MQILACCDHNVEFWVLGSESKLKGYIRHESAGVTKKEEFQAVPLML